MPTLSATSIAIVTPSYALDFDRCAILCASIDAHVRGYEKHYLLVAGRDVPLFQRLATPRRIVVDARSLLPKWLVEIRSLFTIQRSQTYWVSRRTLPLTGWHVQQLLKIAIAFHIPESAILFCDSDTAFVRGYDVQCGWKGDSLRLYREHEGLKRRRGLDHESWVARAAVLFDVPRQTLNEHDYIGHLISWRTDVVRAMCSRIEDISERSWIESLARSWALSEYMLYGHFVDDIESGKGHFEDRTNLCQSLWSGVISEDQLRKVIDNLPQDKVAIGLQSYIDFDPRKLRKIIDV